jgi:RNA polymerase sigma-54 factor
MSGMSLDLNIRQRLEQRQVLSLQTIQSLNILQLATTDLQNLIDKELEENPTLEMAAEEVEVPPENKDVASGEVELAEEQPDQLTPSGETYEEALDYLARNTDIDDYQSTRSIKSRYDGEPDAKQEAFNNIAAEGITLADHLLEQLRLRGMHAEDVPLFDAVVHSLDERGYLSYPLQDIATQAGASLIDAEEALREVQALEPRGVGARDLAECLLLQVRESDPDYPLLKKLLTEHWDDVLKNRLPKLAKDLGISVDDAKGLLEILSVLDPHPGQEFAHTARQMVTPDVVVEEDEQGVFKVRLTRENLPRLGVNDYYLRMIQQKSGDKATINFLKGKLNHAKALIEALEQRQSTLERVANSIVRRQEKFLREGMQALAPLKMQDIADELGIHHSTVWRAVYGKYIETPQGILAMNSFFTGGMPSSGDDQGAISREAVKVKLKALVDEEDKQKPLSDMALAKKLADAGIEASRRVVTKYREELGIADSRVRRAY